MNLLGSYSPTAANAGEVLGTSTSIIGQKFITLTAVTSGLASGTSAKVYFQMPVGDVYYDVGCLAFTTGSVVKQLCVAVEALSAAATLSTLSLTDDTAVDGFVGDTVRATLVTVGTYSAGSVTAYYKAYT